MSHLQAVLVNAGPLITLAKLNRLGLLAAFGRLCIPRAVYREVVVEGGARGMPDALHVHLFAEHHEIQIVEGSHLVLESYRPRVVPDPGERELLAIARTLSNPLVLLDDEAARAEARRLGLQVKGTLGVIVQAVRSGRIERSEADLLLLEVAERPDIWISAELCHQVRQSLG